MGYQKDTPSSVILHVSNITENEEHDEKQVLLHKNMELIIICVM